jgi:hypothetical protein
MVTAGSVFTMVGTGAASAATMLSARQAATSPAATLQSLHDTLAAQWRAGNIEGMSATRTALAGELATLRTPKGQAAMAPGAVTTLTRAQQRNDDVGTRLAALRSVRGNTAAAPPAPPDLSGLAAAIQALLSTLLALVQGLLGAPPPLPAPPPPTS